MASGSSLHIISFDVPYPANYGGVIEIFYKIRALYEKGVKVILHCFMYGDRKPDDALRQYCEQVYYYERDERLRTHLSLNPYIVRSRKDPQLLENLLRDEYPILFDGLHSCAYLDHPKLRRRKKLVRMHNIEWQYYLALVPDAPSFKHKLYYLLESYKLKQFERVLSYADVIFSISEKETSYCAKFANSIWVPAFHGNTWRAQEPFTSNKKYVIYHGNLDISDNRKAALLLDEICGELKVDCIIAGKNTGTPFVPRHASLVVNPSDEQIQKLIREAHICFVYTDIENGIKLKLLNSLYNGKWVIGNQNVVSGTKLDELVLIANTREEIKAAIKSSLDSECTEVEFEKRQSLLQQYYDNRKNAEHILAQL